ncbi:hypothetical protein VNO80_25588 [Phaseolus coccineus]|uniref:Uncharacterized protein n=1 Tax=Phaseolus coccineus TaxID=3886 RepID=A0AAN9QP53_PHACN
MVNEDLTIDSVVKGFAENIIVLNFDSNPVEKERDADMSPLESINDFEINQIQTYLQCTNSVAGFDDQVVAQAEVERNLQEVVDENVVASSKMQVISSVAPNVMSLCNPFSS